MKILKSARKSKTISAKRCNPLESAIGLIICEIWVETWNSVQSDTIPRHRPHLPALRWHAPVTPLRGGLTQASCATENMSTREETWLSLSHGIEIPGYRVTVPWLATQADLFQRIPFSEFTISKGGGWPMLRFKFLGFSALWGFNFVSSPGGRLSELQFRNDEPSSSKRSYRRSRPLLQRSLGRPNVVDHGLYGQQTWDIGCVHVDNWIARGTQLPSMRTVAVHKLSIRHARQLFQTDPHDGGRIARPGHPAS